MPNDILCVKNKKKEIRNQMLRQRNSLTQDAIRGLSACIVQKVLRSEAFIQCRTLLTYINIGSEVETIPIIREAWAMGKTVAVPVVLSGPGQMAFNRIQSFDGLRRSAFGCLEPIFDPALRCEADGESVLLVPGAAFDMRGYRIGYGGGYYDAFLAEHSRAISIGLAYPFQMVGELPIEQHDVAVCVVITE